MATMVDVARRAGVSVATVSHVLNRTRPVRPGTRSAVLQAIEELRYTPNTLARSLVTARTRSIGLAVSAISNPYFTEILQGVEAAALEQGYGLLVADPHDDPEHERRVARLLHERRVDGLIVAPSARPAALVEYVARHRVPTVFLDRVVAGPGGAACLSGGLGAGGPVGVIEGAAPVGVIEGAGPVGVIGAGGPAGSAEGFGLGAGDGDARGRGPGERELPDGDCGLGENGDHGQGWGLGEDAVLGKGKDLGREGLGGDGDLDRDGELGGDGCRHVGDGYRFDQVCADGAEPMAWLTGHLAELGHRRIGLVAGLAGLSTSAERVVGYRAGLTRAGLPTDPTLMADGRSEVEGAERATHALLSAADPPSALVTANNAMTIGALRALRARRLRVPDDIVLACFDDFSWADLFAPRLTAVRQPSRELGARAMGLLLDRLAAPEQPSRIVRLPCTIVHRTSCGCPEDPQDPRGPLDLHDRRDRADSPVKGPVS